MRVIESSTENEVEREDFSKRSTRIQERSEFCIDEHIRNRQLVLHFGSVIAVPYHIPFNEDKVRS
jgi:hypothetical protein